MSRFSSGGATRIDVGYFTVSGNAVFSFNMAIHGGAIYLYHSAALFHVTVLDFTGNTADEGGGIYSLGSTLIIKVEQLNFINNTCSRNKGWCTCYC